MISCLIIIIEQSIREKIASQPLRGISQELAMGSIMYKRALCCQQKSSDTSTINTNTTSSKLLKKTSKIHLSTVKTSSAILTCNGFYPTRFQHLQCIPRSSFSDSCRLPWLLQGHKILMLLLEALVGVISFVRYDLQLMFLQPPAEIPNPFLLALVCSVSLLGRSRQTSVLP